MAETLEVAGIRLDTVGLEAGVRRSTTELDRLDKKADEVQDEFGRLRRQTNDLQREMQRGNASIRAIETRLGGLARTAQRAAAALGFTVGLASLGLLMNRVAGFTFRTNVEFERLEAQLRTTEGTAAGASRAFDAITQFAVETPFEVENLTEAFVRLRTFGLNITTRDLRGMGNIASAFSRDIVDVADAVIAAVTTSVEPIRRFGFSAVAAGDQLNVSFQGVERTIPRSINALAEFVSEMGNTSRVAGAMGFQMETMSGSLSNLRDALSLAAKAAGDAGLNTEVSRLIQLLIEAASEGDGFARSMGEGAAGGVRILTTLLQEGAPILTFWADQLARLGDQSANLARPRVTAFQGISADVGSEATAEERQSATADAVRRVNNLLTRAAEEREAIAGSLEIVNDRLAKAIAAEGPRPRGFAAGPPGTGLMTGITKRIAGAVGIEARTAREQIEAEKQRLEEQLSRFDLEIAAGVRRRRELQVETPVIPESVLGKEGGDKAKKEKIDPLDAALKRFTQREREVRALTDALAGTSVALDPLEQLEERLTLLRQAIEDIATARLEKGLTPVDDMLRHLIAEADDLGRVIQRMKDLQALMKEVAGTRVETADLDSERRRKALEEEFEAERQAAEQAAQGIASAFATAFSSIATQTDDTAEAFRRMVESILNSISRLLIESTIVEPLVGAILSGFGGTRPRGGGGGFEEVVGLGPANRTQGAPPPRQLGGPVMAGQPVRVGEKGEEVFVPSVSGRIIPHDEVRAAVERAVVTRHEVAALSGRAVARGERARDGEFAPPRELGGPVMAAQAVRVGEKGEELFIPAESGRIVPHGAVSGVRGETGTEAHVHFHNTFSFQQIDNSDSYQWAERNAPMLAGVMQRQWRIMGSGRPRGN